ncbi:MAG TPA: DUF2911 domain-containing protein [Thermoanaerobaculia bacterium]|nr:DUF2911 domain-containing protein [Thermoanaerobaculia bacterium]
MPSQPLRSLSLVASLGLLAVLPAAAQFPGVTLPPSGDNQHSIVTQYIGLVSVTVDYHSPDVHAPDGADRAGKIWGELVPYGLVNLGFGTCGDQCPWRGGANENTVFAVSHDVKVQGKPLAAGSYGLHFIPGKDTWTVVFSKNYTSWGSFSYDAGEDALRVEAKPRANDYHEWLTYEFIDRQPDRATVALEWERLALPLDITVENTPELYVENLRRELRNSAGFAWQNYVAAARYCLQSKVHLDEGLKWAEYVVSPKGMGQENFTSLSALADLQEANQKTAEAAVTRDKALNHPTAGPFDIHTYARQLQGIGKQAEALKVFELNARRHPGEWPIEMGLARGYAGVGKKQEAIEHAKKAVTQAPDDGARRNVESFLKQLEASPAKG